jgi:hypothetical protein
MPLTASASAPERSEPGRPVAQVGEIDARLARLTSLTPPELRAEWRRLFPSQPPRLSLDLMQRAIAHRIQEIAFGGISKATGRRLASLASDLEKGASALGPVVPRLEPGARLVREWGGRSFTVVVTEDGFRFGDKIYRSLTQIAGEITGAHWSGPRFFGLTGRTTAALRQSMGEAPHG